jgi:hypothetical protein
LSAAAFSTNAREMVMVTSWPNVRRGRGNRVADVGKVTADPEDVSDDLGLADIDHFAQFIRGTKAPPSPSMHPTRGRPTDPVLLTEVKRARRCFPAVEVNAER